MSINYYHQACFPFYFLEHYAENFDEEEIIGSKNGKNKFGSITKKLRYSKGIDCASNIIITNAEMNKKITIGLIKIIVVALILGERVDLDDPLATKVLSHAKNNDYDFSEIAYCTATKVKEKGGERMAMYSAVVSVLVNRNVKAFQNVSFKKSQYDSIAESSIKQVMPLLSFSVDFENDDDFSLLLSDLDSDSIRFSESLVSKDFYDNEQFVNTVTEGSVAFSDFSRPIISKSKLSKEISYLYIVDDSNDSQSSPNIDNVITYSNNVKTTWIEKTISDFTIETEISLIY